MSKHHTITGGTIAAALTPRQSREQSIDLAATLELTDFLLEGGADSIALLSSAGEFVHFMLEDRARMLDFAVKRSRLPILANISHSTCDGAIWLGQEAAASGVAATLLMPPYYFRYSQETIRTYCLQVAEALVKDVPVFLCNVPLATFGMTKETTAALLASGLFSGIQDSSGDPQFLEALLGGRGPGSHLIFCGNDYLGAAAAKAGVDGWVSDVACVVPELIGALLHAIRSGEAAQAERLDARVQEFLSHTQPFPVPFGIREAARQRKVKVGCGATPLSPSEQSALLAFGAWFKDWLPGVLVECRSNRS